jgi:hypothetical protein
MNQDIEQLVDMLPSVERVRWDLASDSCEKCGAYTATGSAASVGSSSSAAIHANVALKAITAAGNVTLNPGRVGIRPGSRFEQHGALVSQLRLRLNRIALPAEALHRNHNGLITSLSRPLPLQISVRPPRLRVRFKQTHPEFINPRLSHSQLTPRSRNSSRSHEDRGVRQQPQRPNPGSTAMLARWMAALAN